MVVDIRRQLHVLDGEDGHSLWSKSEVGQPLAVPNGPILYRPDPDTVEALDPATGDLLWSVLTGDKISGPFVGSQGELFLLDRLQKPPHFSLRRIEPKTGETLWRRDLPRLRARPIVTHENQVFVTSHTVPSGGTEVQALDLETGQPSFRFQAEKVDKIQFRDDDLLMFSITPRRSGDLWDLQQRDRHTGELDWCYRAQGLVRSPAHYSPDGSRVLLFEQPRGRLETRLLALDRESGQKAWEIRGGLGTELVFGGQGQLFFHQTEFDSKGLAFARLRRADPVTGDLLWSVEVDAPPRWLQATPEGHLVTVADRGPDASVVRCFDGDSGELRWERRAEHGVQQAIVGPPGHLFLVENGCRLVSLEPATGRVQELFSSGHSLAVTHSTEATFKLWATDHDGAVYSWSHEGPSPSSQPTGSLRQLSRWQVERPLEDGPRGLYLDWDLDGQFSPINDVVLMRQSEEGPEPLRLADLPALDRNGDGRLEDQELEGVWLWIDSDRNGEISEPDRFQPLLDGHPFDRARVELEEARMALASGGRCGGGRGLCQNQPRA